MRIVWKLTLYRVSEKTGYRAKIEGQVGSGPWVFASGDHATEGGALRVAADQMSEYHQSHLARFVDGSRPQVRQSQEKK